MCNVSEDSSDHGAASDPWTKHSPSHPPDQAFSHRTRQTNHFIIGPSDQACIQLHRIHQAKHSPSNPRPRISPSDPRPSILPSDHLTKHFTIRLQSKHSLTIVPTRPSILQSDPQTKHSVTIVPTRPSIHYRTLRQSILPSDPRPSILPSEPRPSILPSDPRSSI